MFAFSGPLPRFPVPWGRRSAPAHRLTDTCRLWQGEVSAHSQSPPLRLELYLQHPQPTAFFSGLAATSVLPRAFREVLVFSWPHNPKMKQAHTSCSSGFLVCLFVFFPQIPQSLCFHQSLLSHQSGPFLPCGCLELICAGWLR